MPKSNVQSSPGRLSGRQRIGDQRAEFRRQASRRTREQGEFSYSEAYRPIRTGSLMPSICSFPWPGAALAGARVDRKRSRPASSAAPPPASTVARRFEAARTDARGGVAGRGDGFPIVADCRPRAFLGRIATVADAVVIDHYIGGDGSSSGARTLRTALPAAMAAVDSASLALRVPRPRRHDRREVPPRPRRLRPRRLRGPLVDGSASLG